MVIMGVEILSEVELWSSLSECVLGGFLYWSFEVNLVDPNH